MNPTLGTNRKKMLIPYIMIMVGLSVYFVGVTFLLREFGAIIGWFAAPVTIGLAGWFTRKLAIDTQEMTPGSKLAYRFMGSGVIASLVILFSYLTAGYIDPLNFISITVYMLFCSMWLLVFCLMLIRYLLAIRFGCLSVARQVIDEALGSKVIIGFLAIVLFVVPLMMFMLSEKQLVHYRIQQFLMYSLTMIWVLLSLLIIFFGCWSLGNEVRDKQIHMNLVKPIGRGAYLFGKWLGLTLLSGMLLMVVGLAVFLFVTQYLAKQPPKDTLDAVSIHEEILTARVATEPLPPQSIYIKVDERLKELMKESESLVTERGGKDAARSELFHQELLRWRSLGPYENSSNYSQVYSFKNLDKAKLYGNFVTLRFKIKIKGGTPGLKTTLELQPKGSNRSILFDSALNVVQRVPIATAFIDDEGKLDLIITNRNPNISVSFPSEELEMLYTVDSFETNFIRAMLMIWIKVSFVAALAVSMATFLSFALAAAGSLLVFVTAIISEYLLEAVSSYQVKDAGTAGDLFATVIRFIDLCFTKPLAQFGKYKPISLLTEGRYISWTELLGCLGWVGLLWTACALVAGWLIFRRRELARVQV